MYSSLQYSGEFLLPPDPLVLARRLTQAHDAHGPLWTFLGLINRVTWSLFRAEEPHAGLSLPQASWSRNFHVNGGLVTDTAFCILRFRSRANESGPTTFFPVVRFAQSSFPFKGPWRKRAQRNPSVFGFAIRKPTFVESQVFNQVNS